MKREQEDEKDSHDCMMKENSDKVELKERERGLELYPALRNCMYSIVEV
jgi:hypothetical protein